MFINQSNNKVSGDLVAGNKSETIININSSSATDELSALYEKLKFDGAGDASNGKFCDKLEHYLSVVTDGDVRGLEAKLQDSGRYDLLNFAMQLKEQATKNLMRYQSSRTAQRVYTILLDELHTRFTLIVTPTIQAGASREEVDERISLILQSTKGMLGENILEFTVKDLLALIYFLGGNCHIRWDKC